MVTFGESHTLGISATKREYGWAERLRELIDRFQETLVTLVNRGIGADIVSKACPVYRLYAGKRPIAIEHYRKHVIEENPDLVVISYGYNDMRAGTPLDAFCSDMYQIVGHIRRETESTVVLLDLYFIPGKGYTQRAAAAEKPSWDRGTPESHVAYNAAIKHLAEEHDALFVPVFDAMAGAEWLFCSPSGVGDTHANDLGHQIVANRVFEVLAVTCSALARKALSDREKVGKSPWRHEPVSANDSRSRQVLLKAEGR